MHHVSLDHFSNPQKAGKTRKRRSEGKIRELGTTLFCSPHNSCVLRPPRHLSILIQIFQLLAQICGKYETPMSALILEAPHYGTMVHGKGQFKGEKNVKSATPRLVLMILLGPRGTLYMVFLRAYNPLLPPFPSFSSLHTASLPSFHLSSVFSCAICKDSRLGEVYFFIFRFSLLRPPSLLPPFQCYSFISCFQCSFISFSPFMSFSYTNLIQGSTYRTTVR